MEDLLSKMHGLNIREANYAVLHAQLCCRWPNIADDYPKPELPLTAPPPATYAYQAPPPTNASAAQQWPRTPALTAMTPQNDAPNSFFRSRPHAEGCAFCNQNGHRVRECSFAEEYVHAGHAIICTGRIHLPNGNPIPNDGTQHGLKSSIDAWHTACTAAASAPPPAPPALRDPPPHPTTVSRFEEITDSFMLQVLTTPDRRHLSNSNSDTGTDPDMPRLTPESDYDTDSDFGNEFDEDRPDIFRVFTAKKKKCANKPC